MIRISGTLCVLAALFLSAGGGIHRGVPSDGVMSEVVVTLASPPVAGRDDDGAAAAAVDRGPSSRRFCERRRRERDHDLRLLGGADEPCRRSRKRERDEDGSR